MSTYNPSPREEETGETLIQKARWKGTKEGGGARPTVRSSGSAGRRPAFHTRRASIHSSSRRSAHASEDRVDSSTLTRGDRLGDTQGTLILEIGTLEIIFSLIKGRKIKRGGSGASQGLSVKVRGQLLES